MIKIGSGDAENGLKLAVNASWPQGWAFCVSGDWAYASPGKFGLTQGC
jgi:hypothetical protein